MPRAFSLGVHVLPTHVGMARGVIDSGDFTERSPHTRGDGPIPENFFFFPHKFSPHTWGWPVLVFDETVLNSVLPTHVGMARVHWLLSLINTSSPHTRGDGPQVYYSSTQYTKFSPHTWGWPVVANPIAGQDVVLPTHVGMARVITRIKSIPPGSPHTRGDGPGQPLFSGTHKSFSPHTWGWPARGAGDEIGKWVLPTHVGMARSPLSTFRPCGCSPHTRGDGPSLF